MQQPVALQFVIAEIQLPSGEWSVVLTVGMGPASFNLILDANQADTLCRGLKEKAELVRSKIIAPLSKIVNPN